MAVTRKPPRHARHQPLPDYLSERLAGLIPPGSRLCVALSGGRDSVALLHALYPLRHLYPLSAIHVNHGLSPNASAWQTFCQTLCASLSVAFAAVAVQVDPCDARGIEAAARAERRRVFAGQTADYIVLAHHQDDQAETVLLQLLRGAGIKGLAAMPVVLPMQQGPALLRPLLELPRSQIEAWARSRQLTWVDDESNLDSRYRRNFLRHDLLPRVGQHYPGWRSALARSASLMAEADGLLDELAGLDARQAIRANRLDCALLHQLSPARARNLLRYFVQQHGLAAPSASRLADMLGQLLDAAPHRDIRIELPPMVLRRYQGWAWLLPEQPDLPGHLQWIWQGEPVLWLPELDGRLVFDRDNGQRGGLRIPGSGQLTIRLRQGGESFRAQFNRPQKSLKALLQETGLPPWQRARLPLLWHEDQLVCVPGIGVAVDWQTRPGESGWVVRWDTNTRSDAED